MRIALRLCLLTALVLPGVARAADPKPQKIGDFGNWIAASYTEEGKKVCYAFVRPSRSEPSGRVGVLLSVSHRAGARDSVTVASGYTYPRGNAEATMAVGPVSLPFYTAGSTAAARDGAAATKAFRNGKEAVLKGPGQNGKGAVVDTFPLAGFGAAHDAISRECPTAAPPPPAKRR